MVVYNKYQTKNFSSVQSFAICLIIHERNFVVIFNAPLSLGVLCVFPTLDFSPLTPLL